MILSTVILSSTLLVIILSATSLANQLLRGEVENTEFNQAKDVLSSLEKMIDRVASSSGSSGYIRSSYLTTYPSFEVINNRLQVYAGGTLLKELNITVVKVRGGRAVTGVFQSISGASTPLVVGVSTPIGWLFTNRTDAEEVVLDIGRVRCVYKGLSQLWNGAAFETFNILEVTVISLSKGTIAFQNTGAFVIQYMALETHQYQFTGDIEVKGVRGSQSEVRSLYQMGGNPSYRTIMNFFVINVEVSVVNG